jgi:hypothetical protein
VQNSFPISFFPNTQFLFCICSKNLCERGTKMTVFWVVAPCSLEVYQHFRGLYCLCHQGDVGSSKDLRNTGKFLLDYMTLQPRRQPSLYSPVWEPQILLHEREFVQKTLKLNLIITIQDQWSRWLKKSLMAVAQITGITHHIHNVCVSWTGDIYE